VLRDSLLPDSSPSKNIFDYFLSRRLRVMGESRARLRYSGQNPIDDVCAHEMVVNYARAAKANCGDFSSAASHRIKESTLVGQKELDLQT
jgi:hypothetical protein